MSNEELKNLLCRARHIIEDPDDWCQGRAVDEHGRQCASQAYSTAVVVMQEEGLLENCSSEAWWLLLGAAQKMGFDGVVKVNDTGPPEKAHKRVLELFDAAIAEVGGA